MVEVRRRSFPPSAAPRLSSMFLFLHHFFLCCFALSLSLSLSLSHSLPRCLSLTLSLSLSHSISFSLALALFITYGWRRLTLALPLSRFTSLSISFYLLHYLRVSPSGSTSLTLSSLPVSLTAVPGTPCVFLRSSLWERRDCVP